MLPAKPVSILLPFWLSAGLLCVKTCPATDLPLVVATFHLSVCELDAFHMDVSELDAFHLSVSELDALHMAVCLPWLFVAWLYATWLRLVAVCPAV